MPVIDVGEELAEYLRMTSLYEEMGGGRRGQFSNSKRHSLAVSREITTESLQNKFGAVKVRATGKETAEVRDADGDRRRGEKVEDRKAWWDRVGATYMPSLRVLSCTPKAMEECI